MVNKRLTVINNNLMQFSRKKLCLVPEIPFDDLIIIIMNF